MDERSGTRCGAAHLLHPPHHALLASRSITSHCRRSQAPSRCCTSPLYGAAVAVPLHLRLPPRVLPLVASLLRRRASRRRRAASSRRHLVRARRSLHLARILQHQHLLPSLLQRRQLISAQASHVRRGNARHENKRLGGVGDVGRRDLDNGVKAIGINGGGSAATASAHARTGIDIDNGIRLEYRASLLSRQRGCSLRGALIAAKISPTVTLRQHKRRRERRGSVGIARHLAASRRRGRACRCIGIARRHQRRGGVMATPRTRASAGSGTHLRASL